MLIFILILLFDLGSNVEISEYTHSQVKKIIIETFSIMDKQLDRIDDDQSIELKIEQLNSEISGFSNNFDCQFEFGRLDQILELQSPNLQFSVIALVCFSDQIQNFELKDGFLSIQHFVDQSHLKRNYSHYLSQSEDLQLFSFRPMFLEKYIWHQCQFDGLAQECLKGNNDHLSTLGRDCKSRYKNSLLDCEISASDYYNQIYELIRVMPYIVFHELFSLQRTRDVCEKYVNFFYLLMLVLPSYIDSIKEILLLVTIQQLAVAKKLNYFEKMSLYTLAGQYFLTIFIDSMIISHYAAMGLMTFMYFCLFSHALIILASQKVSIIILYFYIVYYIRIVQTAIEINTFIDNESKFGLNYLILLMGNQRGVYFYELIEFKTYIVGFIYQIELVGVEYAVYFSILILVNFLGEQFIQSHGNVVQHKNLFLQILQNLAYFNLSLIYLILPFLSALLNQPQKEYHWRAMINYHVFVILFFYFPTDLPFFLLVPPTLEIWISNFAFFRRLKHDVQSFILDLNYNLFIWPKFLRIFDESEEAVADKNK